MWLHWMGCQGAPDEPEPEPTVETTPIDPFDVALEAPLSRWDPLLVFAELAPSVADAGGAEVALDSWPHGEAVAWRPAEGWEPGPYQVIALDGAALGWTFEVGDYGEAPLPAESLVGRAWSPVSWNPAAGVTALAAGLGTPTVVVEGFDGDLATISVVLATPDVTCVVLRDTATYDGATLSWSWPAPVFRVDDPGGPIEIEARDLFAEIAFAADGASGAGRAHGEVDTRNLYPLVGLDAPGDVCALFDSLGSPCSACPDAAQTCFRDDIVQIAWDEVTPPALAGLPVCGFDRIDLNPDVGCDASIDCGCAGSPGPAHLGWLLALAGAAWARRRP
ncbi:MAG: hypothetical protein ABMA64_17895 [Myxococcota bacterium]